MSLSKADAPVSILNTGAKVALPFLAVVLGVIYLSGVSTEGALVRFANALLTSSRCFPSSCCSPYSSTVMPENAPLLPCLDRQRRFGHRLDGVFPLAG